MNDGPPRSVRGRRVGGRTLVLLLVLTATVLLGVSLGSVGVPLAETGRALWKGVTGQGLEGSEVIVWQLRFPRVVLGLLVGGILGACGGAFQGVFRNPLADPYLMGVASGAYFGVTIAIVRGWSWNVTPLLAMIGALGSVLVTLALARQGRSFPPTRLILAGVVVGSVTTAISTFLMLQGQDRVRQVFTATLGNLALGGWPEVRMVALYGAVGVGVVLFLARALNTVQLGDATARSLGVPVERLRLLVILAASVATAGAVSFAGIIGFVGLVTPHIVRRVWSADFRVLLPVSALAGGTLLVLADLMARTLTRPAELPVGIVTTLIGGPFFLYLLRKTK